MPVLQKTNPEIERLWEILPKPYGIVRWFARDREGTVVVGDFADSPRGLSMAADAYQHLNFYVQPNPTAQRTKLRSAAKDVTHWSYLFVDVDPMAEAEDPRPDLALTFALQKLSSFVGKALDPLVIDSGRGMQAWVRLEDVHLYESVTLLDGGTIGYDGVNVVTSRHVARTAANYALHELDKALVAEGQYLGQEVKGYYGCRIDVSCSDLPRLMRCPGTFNTRTKRTTKLVAEGRMHPGVARLLVVATPPLTLVPRTIVLRPGLPWQRIVNKLTKTAAVFLREGAREPGRHKTMSATLKSLKDNGIDAQRALDALVFGNAKTKPPLDLRELERMVHDEYRDLTSSDEPATIPADDPTQ